MADDVDDDDRLEAEHLVTPEFVARFDEDGGAGVIVSALVIVEVIHPETGQLNLRAASSRGLVPWRKVGMLTALLDDIRADMTGCGGCEDTD